MVVFNFVQRLEPVPPEPKTEPRPVRPPGYNPYNEGLGRPGSRTAYADPHKYSHYVNYEQIQQHIRLVSKNSFFI